MATVREKLAERVRAVTTNKTTNARVAKAIEEASSDAEALAIAQNVLPTDVIADTVDLDELTVERIVSTVSTVGRASTERTGGPDQTPAPAAAPGTADVIPQSIIQGAQQSQTTPAPAAPGVGQQVVPGQPLPDLYTFLQQEGAFAGQESGIDRSRLIPDGVIAGEAVFRDPVNGNRYVFDSNGRAVRAPDRPLPAPFIGGFPEDYRATRDVGPNAYGEYRPGNPSQVAPQYRAYDEWRMFASLSPERRAEVNLALISAGVLDEDAPLGVWTRQSATGMSYLMEEANARGTSWVTVARERQKAIEEGREDALEAQRRANPFIAPVYRAPDQASVRQAVRQSMAGFLGRDPHDWELALLGEDLTANYRKQYTADVSAARIQHDAGNRAIATGATSGGGGTVGAVDPFARLQEKIRELYQDEADAETAEEERAVNTRLISNSLAGFTGAVQGAG